MLGIDRLKVAPDLVLMLSKIDSFQGEWRALEKHTTGLQILGAFAKHGQKFRSVLEPLKDHPLRMDDILKLSGQSNFRDGEFVLELQAGSIECADADMVVPLLQKLVDWYEEASANRVHHPLILIAAFWAIFLQISPLAQGNRKIASILVQILLFKSGYVYAPYVSLDGLVEARDADFYAALLSHQESVENQTPVWDGWLVCALAILSEQADILHGKIYEEEKDLSLLPDLSAKIMALFETHKRLQMREIMRMTKGSRATLKLRLNELVDEGYLKRHGQARSTWYGLV